MLILMLYLWIKDSEKKKLDFEKNKKIAKEDYFDEQKRGY